MAEIRSTQLEETKRHGSVLFPFNIYPCSIPGTSPAVALHWQKSLEILHFKKGSLHVQMGMTHLDASVGDLVILPPGTLHALRRITGITAHYDTIICEMEFLGSGAADLCARQYLIPLSAGQLLHPVHVTPEQPEYQELAGCLNQAEHLCDLRSPGYELAVRACMLRLIFLLMQLQPGPPALEQPGTARLKEVLQRIEQEYTQPLTVEQMAAGCGCSSSHFMRWFRQMTGSSFVTYLNDYRLTAAAELLRSTNDKILTISQETGFETLSNFNRQFKSRYGGTPREYRSGKLGPGSPGNLN